MKKIKNIIKGHHVNSKYWQDWKKQRPNLKENLFQLCIGIVLSDATIYHISKEAYIKFEQGYAQKNFVDHLFTIIKEYTFIENYGIRYSKKSNHVVHSYWFKTFSHPTFTKIYSLFYVNNKKSIQNSIILNYLEEEGLAYWIIGDGSLHRDKRVLTLHTQSFSFLENLIISNELNFKFLLNSRVIIHKSKYVIQFTSKDANRIHDIIKDHIINDIKYKIPRKIDKSLKT